VWQRNGLGLVFGMCGQGRGGWLRKRKEGKRKVLHRGARPHRGRVAEGEEGAKRPAKGKKSNTASLTKKEGEEKGGSSISAEEGGGKKKRIDRSRR